MPFARLSVPGLFGEQTDWTRFAWRPFREGVEIAPLYGGEGSEMSMALLRYAPGATVPKHLHKGIEHILVLSGSQSDEIGEHSVGHLLVHGPGTTHSITSERGCIALAIWERPVEILEPAIKQ